MKWLLLNTDYSEFLHSFYEEHPGLEKAAYAEQMIVRMRALFGMADFYSRHLRALGHEAEDVHVSNEILQTAWAREHDVKVHAGSWLFPSRPGPGAWFSRFKFRGWNYDILAAQIRHHRPDVLLNLAMDGVRPEFLREIKRHVGLLVGQHAATPLNPKRDWSVYDLALSSFPPTVDWCRGRGLAAELLRLAFEPTILEQIPDTPPSIPVSFIGSFSDVHTSRTALLEILARKVDLSVWGPPAEGGFRDEHLTRCYRGQAWGREMYRLLASSRITINHHGNIAPFANNMRLYEATGVGTLLVTDAKPNLSDLFEPDREVVVYHNPEECIAKVQYFLEHEDERRTLALAGQRRTLRDHTYDRRMQELTGIVKQHLRASPTR